MKMRPFWDTVPFIIVGTERRFRRAYCLHQQRDVGNLMIRRYSPLKRRSTPTKTALYPRRLSFRNYAPCRYDNLLPVLSNLRPCNKILGRSQWPLGCWDRGVRIPPGAWIFVSYVYTLCCPV
jgi:hypothetical protein